MSGSQYCVEPTYTNHRLAIYLKFKGNGHLEISVAKPGKPTQGVQRAAWQTAWPPPGPGGLGRLGPRVRGRNGPASAFERKGWGAWMCDHRAPRCRLRQPQPPKDESSGQVRDVSLERPLRSECH